MRLELQTQIKHKHKQPILPESYSSKLDFFATEKAIKLVKDTFERKLAEKLLLLRVSAPCFLIEGTGLQDDFAGTQMPAIRAGIKCLCQSFFFLKKVLKLILESCFYFSFKAFNPIVMAQTVNTTATTHTIHNILPQKPAK